MQYFINGAKYAFGTTLGDPVDITAISNANPAIITTGTQPTAGDVILLSSNWTDLQDLACYAGAAGALEGIDTSDVTRYVPGEAVPASYQKVSDFVNLSQIREIAQSGGDTNTFSWAYIDDSSPRQRSRPTDQNPLVLTFTLDYDPTLPWVAALEELTYTRQLTTMRETLPTGDVLLYTGYMAYQKSPSRTRNENMTVTAVMSINSDILRYPASFFAGS